MTTAPLSDSRLANLGARAVVHAFDDFHRRFRIIGKRARIRFQQRDWHAMAADAVERLDVYTEVARATAEKVADLLAHRIEDRMVWAGMKAVYSGMIQERPDWEVAETFFNSVTRRIFTTVGVDQRIEFVDTDFDAPPVERGPSVFRAYGHQDDLAGLVARVVADAALGVGFSDLEGDARRAAERIDSHLRRIGAPRMVDRVEVAIPVFYRGKGAYLVGRLLSGPHSMPLVVSVLHRPEGAVIDAVLLTENAVSILFSFARSYFHVDTDRPHALAGFVRTLVPRKRRAEIYISLGYNKHGKTELYRQLRLHMAQSTDCFVPAAGTPGLVMVVFTLPGFDMVFKVIRDRFPANKQVTRSQVLDRYRLVFHHDRAGRLVDAQVFEHLEFPRERFDRGLAAQLAEACGESVTVGPDTVTIHHAYVERRVVPLDLFLRNADPRAAQEAIIDFGQAIKDMAAGGVFPGDMLLKNFGVTRHGRVVFYDYDELTTLDSCNFRRMPPPSSLDDEMSADPWFSVGPNDVFPEEFSTFLGVTGELRDAFMTYHADLFDADTWRTWQSLVASGELIDVYPYDISARLCEVSA